MPHAVLCACGALTARTPCAACRARRHHASPYQTPAWRTLTRQITAEHPYCAHCGDTTRLTVHHLNGRDPRDITQGPFTVLCGTCHSQYEADHRVRRATPLTTHIHAIRDKANERGGHGLHGTHDL